MARTTLADLNACSKDDFVAALSNIFEYSPWIAEQAAGGRPFAGVRPLFEAMKVAVDRAPAELRLALIKAHPDLADKTQRAAGLTAESNAEQNSAGLDRLSDAEYDAFTQVNNAYRAKFGFPYIVCVRRQTKDAVLRDFERRLPNDASTEMQMSIVEILRIAALRHDRGGRRGRTDRAVRARREPGGDARHHQCGRPHRCAPDRRRPGADRPLRALLQRRQLFRRARRAVVRSAVPRPDPAALFGRRSRRPSPRAAAGLALELFDLSRELMTVIARSEATKQSRIAREVWIACAPGKLARSSRWK